MKNIFDLSGKVAVVIGGASGIGEAVTVGAAQMGAKVVCLDIRQAEASQVAGRVAAEGCSCEAGELDIRDSAGVQAAFDGVATKYG